MFNLKVKHHTPSQCEIISLDATNLDDISSAQLIEYFFKKSKNLNVKLVKNSEGAPEIKDRSEQITISHSGRYWAAAVSQRSKIGIDLETFKPKSRLSRIAHRYYSSEENRNLSKTLKEYDFVTLALTYWTRKEAYVKMQQSNLFAVLPLHTDLLECHFETWIQANEFVMTLCWPIERSD